MVSSPVSNRIEYPFGLGRRSSSSPAFEDYLLSASEKQASKDFECEARFLNKHDGKNKLILIISSPLAIEVHKNWVIDRFFSHRDRLW